MSESNGVPLPEGAEVVEEPVAQAEPDATYPIPMTTSDGTVVQVSPETPIEIAPPVSETEEAPDPSTVRPWHGSDNPLEALYQHFTAAIAKLKS
jgi:hypothetical protein